MKTSLAFALVATLLVAAVPAHANTNLIQDGSFESVQIASATWTTLSSSSNWSPAASGYEIRNDVAGQAENGGFSDW